MSTSTATFEAKDLEREDQISIKYDPAVVSSWRRRHSEALNGILFSLAMFGASRALATFAIFVGTRLPYAKTMQQAFLSWDSGWFYGTMVHGYPHSTLDPTQVDPAQNTIAFFPLYPMTSRFVHNVTSLTWIESGVFVSVLFGAIATVLIWFIARQLLDAKVANRSVALFSFFPASIASLLLLSDGMMVAFAAGCILALMNRKWFIAGLCAAIATATRPNAILLIACCAWAAGAAIWQRREWRSLIAPILSPLGIFGYFLFLRHQTGDFMAWDHVENQGWAYGKISHLLVFKSFNVLFTHPLVDLNSSVTAVALIVAVIGFVMMLMWRPRAEIWIYALGLCLLAFWAGGTASKLRYVWTAFPLAIAAGRWAKTELRYSLLLSTSALCLGIFTIISLHTNYMIL